MENIVDEIMHVFIRAIEAENEDRKETYRNAIAKLFTGEFSQTDIVQDIMDTFSYPVHCEAVELANGTRDPKILDIHEGALKAAYKTKILELFKEHDKLKGGDE